MLKLVYGASALVLLAACGAKDAPTPTADAPLATDSPGTATSGFNADRNAYFGDMHIHTRNSFDAYIFNVRATADDAYRFAKGETVKHPSGFDMTIAGGPLDFYTVTDHAEYLGILPAMNTEGHPLSELPRAKAMFSTDPDAIVNAFQAVGASVRSGVKIENMYDQELIDSVWAKNVAAAEAHNEPGVFTTFSAYEFTSVTTKSEDGANYEEGTFGGGNLHRNVFFKGKAPARAFSTLDSTNPEDLWDWMDEQRALGIESIAIPHNSNVSDGQMFRLETYNGEALTKAYADQRMRNEPLVEITQVKGTSETHPDLSPNDEWADFEIYDKLLGVHTVSKTKGGFVREAYRNGLSLQEAKGFDPFRFGLVAASDSHTVGGAYAENDYWSKIGLVDGTPLLRGSIPPPGMTWEEQSKVPQLESANQWFSRWGASGLTGVWAEENTREAIFAAFRRKETFATTGPRMKVRFFGGYDYTSALLTDTALTAKAYTGGVPMGSDLMGSGGAAPSFLVWAQRDSNGAALQRAQIIKVTSGSEQIFDIACHTGSPDPVTHRCGDNGASVDMATCTPTGNGASELKTVWSDPTFQNDEYATYYVRVLENPTCRWSTWEALKNGTPPRPDVAQTIQERAYTSPIWYIPPTE